jgi:hypothetical protein
MANYKWGCNCVRLDILVTGSLIEPESFGGKLTQILIQSYCLC